MSVEAILSNVADLNAAGAKVCAQVYFCAAQGLGRAGARWAQAAARRRIYAIVTER